jgi:hypothetical protein
LLQKSLIDGTFSENDFEFKMADEIFDALYFLVDGIYPPLSCFVRPLSMPLGGDEALFSMWQESPGKDIERFFGMFKKKYIFVDMLLICLL